MTSSKSHWFVQLPSTRDAPLTQRKPIFSRPTMAGLLVFSFHQTRSRFELLLSPFKGFVCEEFLQHTIALFYNIVQSPTLRNILCISFFIFPDDIWVVVLLQDYKIEQKHLQRKISDPLCIFTLCVLANIRALFALTLLIFRHSDNSLHSCIKNSWPFCIGLSFWIHLSMLQILFVI